MESITVNADIERVNPNTNGARLVIIALTRDLDNG
jgi:hypothetical protein